MEVQDVESCSVTVNKSWTKTREAIRFELDPVTSDLVRRVLDAALSLIQTIDTIQRQRQR
jgi:hypothetical protein